MIELKLGRRVIAQDKYTKEWEPGTYITKDLDYGTPQPHCVLLDKGKDSGEEPIWVPGAKPDLSAPPMNGDNVEGSNDGLNFSDHSGRYIGEGLHGRYLVETVFEHYIAFRYIRHPQPTKRERVKAIVNKYFAPFCTPDTAPEMIDEILKICEVKE